MQFRWGGWERSLAGWEVSGVVGVQALLRENLTAHLHRTRGVPEVAAYTYTATTSAPPRLRQIYTIRFSSIEELPALPSAARPRGRAGEFSRLTRKSWRKM